MKRTRAFTKVPRALVATAALVGLTGGAIALSAGTASAATTLTGLTLTISNNTANVKVGTAPTTVTTNTAIYTWTFQTAATQTYTKVTLSLPAGATGSSLTPTVYGITGCTAKTAAVATTMVTLTLAGCASTPASTLVEVQIAGVKNGATTTSQTSVVPSTRAARPTGQGRRPTPW